MCYVVVSHGHTVECVHYSIVQVASVLWPDWHCCLGLQRVRNFIVIMMIQRLAHAEHLDSCCH